MIRRILLGLSGSAYGHVAVKRAVEIARAHQAEITVVTVLDPERIGRVGPVPIGAGHAASKLRQSRIEEVKRRMDAAIADCESVAREAKIRLSVRRETGDPFSLLSSHWRYHDLVVMALRGVIENELLEDPTGEILGLLDKGVRPILAAAPEYRKIRKVLIAYNGSTTSAGAMQRFVQMNPWPEAKVVLATYDAGEDAKAKALLADATAYLKAHGISPETHVGKASAKEAILSDAKKLQADLVVMGNSLRSVLLRKVLGDTTSHIIRTADRPLFLAQ